MKSEGGANRPNENKRSEVGLKKFGIFKKSSSFLVLLMILSILTPVLAFAAVGFKNVEYKGQSVKGTVYVDKSDVNQAVYVEIYGPDGKIINKSDLSGGITVGDYVYYDFSSKVGKYDYVNIFARAMESVSEIVYNHPVKPDKPEKPEKPVKSDN